MAGGPQEENPNQLEQVLEIVYLHLEGDKERVNRWLRSPHPGLAGQQPMDMIRVGQIEKVLEAVQYEIDQREGTNETPPRA